MIFKDRVEAGEKLASLLANKFTNDRDQICIVSLLRGGIIIGDVIAKKLKLNHFPLVVTKIPAPHQPELAIGAICFDKIIWEQSPNTTQLMLAKNKFFAYCRRFNIKKNNFLSLKNKTVILVDDGVATGASSRVACLFLKSQGAKIIILATPVAPTIFNNQGFDQVIILHQDPWLSSVSRFYQNFPQIKDSEINKILHPKS